MSLNYSKSGYPIAVIKGGKNTNEKIYLSDQVDEKIKAFQKIAITDGKFQQIPNTKRERDVGLIIGASGSGKSTWCRNFIIEYHKTYKDNPVYLISHLEEDEALDSLGFIKRVKVGENLLEDQLTVKDFSKCLILFDDVEIITNKNVKNAVYQLLDEVVMTGRHFSISVLMITHASSGNELKRILNECHFLVYFPFGCSLKYVLEKYIGLSTNQIREIKATKSRWASVFKNYPQVVVTEHNIWTLASD
jgi:hypothetical protein